MSKQCPRRIALVDCNSFYVSCERLFDPRLENRPGVVLSNNLFPSPESLSFDWDVQGARLHADIDEARFKAVRARNRR